eukprot:CAMPEP_0113847216 /NCGR_PEP_ID=MMETSP0372-20130328/1746_1 /TAXON_ID=340204 /ORGANISM="Lankesteria abbotti" /LENGTH=202 /DNA_ID=CAMNT_0000816459 /DNA_START=65 /DNA_END=673 /DNA_ORIENTATION=- /assembly_acc=CAM_ASM_000359
MFKKLAVVDCRGHVLGRLASTVAKELLCGQRVVLVRCEDVVVNGPLPRNKLKYMAFLRKKSNSNPRKCSHIHHRAPSMIVRRAIRGMMRHKLSRGIEALSKLKVFDGVPAPYDQKQRVVVPGALRLLKIRHERKVTRLGDLSNQVGWKHDDLIKRLEVRRIEKAQKEFDERTDRQVKYREAENAARQGLDAADKEILSQFDL